MIYVVQILAMLPRIVQPICSDLRKLTSSQKARWHEGVRWGYISLPVCVCRLLPGFWLPIVKETLVVAVPTVWFDREGVWCVYGSFMMSVDLRNERLALALYSLDYSLPLLRTATGIQAMDVCIQSHAHAACCTNCRFHIRWGES